MAKLNTKLTELCNLSYFNPIGLKIAEYTTETTTLLEYGIQENNYIICKYLLTYIKQLTNNLVFSYAVKKNNDVIIDLLLDHIYDYDILDERDEFNNSPLNKAARNGNLSLCKFLVYNNVDILGYQENENLDKKLNNTPLYDAVNSNNYKLVKFLLKNGADPNIWSLTGYGNIGVLPLHAAIENNNYKIAKLLILYGANPIEDFILYYLKYNISIKHTSPLFLAIEEKKIKFIKLFKYHCNAITHEHYLELKHKFK
jgi:ankyrin repeat protein